MTEHPTTDLTPHAPDISRGAVQGASLESRIRYAEVMAEAGLVPRDYQRKPANVLYAVEMSVMLGIHPLAALTGVNVIQSTPSISPALMTALVRRAGHKVRIRVEGTVTAGDVRATCEVIRVDDPSFVYSATWDIDRATRAGLWGNRGSWTNYPEAMLKARAISEVCREAAEDALCGIHYTHEELGATVNVEGEIVDAAPAAATRPAPAAAAPSAEALDADLVRSAILGARGRDQLTANMVEVGAAMRTPDGGHAWHRADDMKKLRVPDANGVEVTAWDLMIAHAQTLPAEAPTQPAPGSADDVVDAEFADDHAPTEETPDAR